MKISSNIIATMTVGNLNRANRRAETAMERLSSGLKINSAKDNPAGLAISNKLQTQVEGLSQANNNAMDGISLIQTAEGALNEVHSMLNRIRELAVQAENGTLQDEDKEKVQQEIDALIAEIESIGKNTQFNGKEVLNFDKNIPIQIGVKSGDMLEIDGTKINMENVLQCITDTDPATNNTTPLSVDDPNLLSRIDQAAEQTSAIRSYLGACQNRLEYTVSNLDVSEENVTASLSRIYDADMAEEMTNYTQYNVISQSGISILAQANQRPQQVLQLLNS
ncbi:MAG: flagellin [Cellulosilyticum sp.]|nr:flagellin [Cellulosilyticum sp.]